MEHISVQDRQILRQLAQKQLAFANSPRNDEILKQWDALANGRRENPTVRLLFSNFPNEVVHPRMRCEGARARELEEMLLSTMVGRELFDDDTPISPTFDIRWKTWVHPFGTQPHITKAEGEGAMGFHIDPIIDDLAEGMDLLRGGSFGVDRQATAELEEAANEAFGDILPVRKVMPSLTGMMTNPLVHLMGMENYYLSMYDYPDELHEAMDMATTVYEQYYDFLENEGLLLPTNGISPINQESFAFTAELPTENVTKTTQC